MKAEQRKVPGILGGSKSKVLEARVQARVPGILGSGTSSERREPLPLQLSSCTIEHVEAVVDASALLAVVLDEPERPAILRATVGMALMAPEVLPFEVGNALVAMRKRGRLEEELVLPAWEAARKIPIRLVAVEIATAIVTALELGIYAYDAYYLQCARAYRRPLLTLDRLMRHRADSLGIRCIPTR